MEDIIKNILVSFSGHIIYRISGLAAFCMCAGLLSLLLQSTAVRRFMVAWYIAVCR